MVAIAHPAPSRHRPQPAARPHLRVIEGGRRAAGPATYRVRRLAAALAVVAVLLALRLVAGAVAADMLPGSTWAGGAGAAEAPAGSATYVVQPGDTLWTIADGLDRPGDIRATVDRLAELNGGAALDVGDRIALPD